VWELDRLGRSLRDLITMFDDLRARGMIGVLAELERSLISERTRAGVKAARRRGVKFGRKLKLTPEQIDHAGKLIDNGEARQYVADLLNVGRSTLYRALIQ